MDDKAVCVLDAGVAGLTTALSLQKKISNVTVLVEKFTTETTSNGAAGLFCPFSSFKAATYQMTRDIVKDSYEYYQDLRQKYGESETGIKEVSGYVLFNITSEEVKWTRHPLQNKEKRLWRYVKERKISLPPVTLNGKIRVDTEKRKKLTHCPGEWKYGSYFKTFIIFGRIFLPFRKNGGKIIQKKLYSFEDLIHYKFDVIVNCTGMGAKELCDDKQLVPMKGQVIKVSAPWIKQFYLLDDGLYIIPGVETTLGGTKQLGNYNLSIDDHISVQIWENCTKFLPSVKEAAVIREWVGLRPYRIPLRLEAETRRVQGEQLKIVHNYGHGAQGITTAPGSAKIATELVFQILKKSKL